MENMKVVFSAFLLLTVIGSYAQDSRPKLTMPAGHTGQIGTAHFSFDQKYIVTASQDNTVGIWEVSSGKLIRLADGVTAEFSPNGNYVLTSSENARQFTTKVLDLKSGKAILTTEGYSDQFSRDGKYIITITNSIGEENQYVKLLDLDSGRGFIQLDGNFSYVSSTQFSPDSKLVITVDKEVKLWNSNSGKLVGTLESGSPSNSAKFSPNGVFIITTDSLTKIWETKSRKLIHTLHGHSKPVTAAEFSPNGNYIVTTSLDSTAKIWSTNSGKLINSLKGHKGWVRGAKFSNDEKYLVTNSYDKTAKIWEVISGKLIHTLEGPFFFVESIEFSRDGKYLLTSNDNTAKIWEVSTGKIVRTFEPHINAVYSAQYSNDGKYILTNSIEGLAELDTKFTKLSGGVHISYQTTVLKQDNSVRLWDAVTGRLINKFPKFSNGIDAWFSEDSKSVVTISDSIKVWDVNSGKCRATLNGVKGAYTAQFSPDGKSIVAVSSDNSAKICDSRSGILVKSLQGHSDRLVSAAFSPNGKYVVTASLDKTAKVWDVNNGALLFSLEGHLKRVRSAQFSSDGNLIATASSDSTAKIWDVHSGKLIRTFNSNNHVFSAQFSPDGLFLATSSLQTANIWELSSGKLIHSLKGHSTWVYSIGFSPNGKYIITSSYDNTSKIWDVTSGKLVLPLEEPIQIHSAKFSKDGKYIITTLLDGSVKIWNGDNPAELLLTFSISQNGGWTVTHASGLFDSSAEAMNTLYFVQDLDIIELNQLKARYYEPGLVKKILAGEKLREVIGFKSIDLPPDIKVGQIDDRGYLPIELVNRGGGIGEVAVYIQGKEVSKDVRDKKINPDAPSLKINYYIGNNKNLVKGENFIGVKAWNKDHWVESRGTFVSFKKGESDSYQPAVHVLTCGISDYAGGVDIDLNYASKDAEDVSKALKLGASKLFGTQKSYIYNLTTTQPKEFWPTKTNILKTFEKISSTAHPLDVIVVYLSGHGINIGGTEGDWYYLTQDAYTPSASAYSDPAIRKQTTISSNELVELFKTIPASKQVLIIDACASGKVVDNLIAKKDVPSSTLRALDRMKDRMGMHIITGCTADAVSYEASRYGQGVLTYSLLEGIRGAALREDEFVDVNKLFQYAQDRVPVLATGIGGIQSPMVFSPNGSQSFDIGQLTEIEKKEVPISQIRPVYIQSNFQDEDEMSDVLGLGKKVDQLLRESAAKGTEAQLIFVPVREYPDGCQLVGRYKKENGKILLKLKKKCEGKDVTLDITGIDLDNLSSQVFKVIAN